ncbi:MAG: TolC family protein [Bacteroidia bacterium]
MRKAIIFILFTSVVFSISKYGNAQEQEKYVFDLQQAIEHAYQHNINVQNAAIDERIAKHKVNETIGIGLPQINSSFTVEYFFEQPTSLIPGEFFGEAPGSFIPLQFGTRYNATASLQASQLLFDGTYLVGLQASKTYQDLSRKELARTKKETAEAVAKAYYNVLVMKERTTLLDANVIRLKKLQSDTKAMYDNGFVELIDVNRVTVSYNNVVTEQKKLERFFDLSVQLLKFQMGMPLSAELTLVDELKTIDFSSSLLAPKVDYTNRIEYSQLQTLHRVNELDLKRYRMAYLPSVSAFATLNAQAQRNEFDIFNTSKKWYPIGIVGASISLPIFTGMQRHYRIQQAKLNLEKVNNQFTQLEQVIDIEYETAKTTMLNSIEALKIQKENMELADEVFRITKIKYDQGIGTNIEIIDAESSLKEAQTNYYNSLYDALIAKIELETATGTFIE